MTRNTADEVLYGARHDDSALFSVAEVERATAANERAPSAESSGYIDVAALAAPQARDEGPAASRLRMASVSPRASAPRRGGLYGVIAGLSLALLSSLTAIAAAPRHEPAPSDEVVTDLAFELEDAASEALDGPFDDERMIILAVDDEYEADEPPQAELAIEPEPAPEPAKKARKSARSTSSKRSSAAAEPATKPAASSKPAKPSEADPMSVECLLSPGKCKTTASAPAPAPKPSAPAETLPEKLDTSALKAGIAAAKDAAEARCEDLADAGDKVEVKLSIRGSNGQVSAAEARGAAAGTALGTCVARELKAARFDRFEAAQQGLVVTVRF